MSSPSERSLPLRCRLFGHKWRYIQPFANPRFCSRCRHRQILIDEPGVYGDE